MTGSRDEKIFNELQRIDQNVYALNDSLVLASEEFKATAEPQLISERPGLRSAEEISSVEGRLALLARQLLKLRRKRKDHLPADIFGEPGWEMLLDLFVQKHLGKQVNVTSLCHATDASATTALRYIELLIKKELAQRYSSPHDRRVSYIELSSKGYACVGTFLIEVFLKRSTRSNHQNDESESERQFGSYGQG